MSVSDRGAREDESSTTVRRLAGAPVRPQTYRNLLYLALAFPLGLAYFVGFTVGTSVGLGLLVTLVGFPILLLTVAGVTLAAGVEAWLARHLVGVDASAPAFLQAFRQDGLLVLPGNGFLAAVEQLLTAPSTWTAVVLVVTKFVFGTASFAALVTAGAITASLLAAPIVYDDPETTVGISTESTPGEYGIGSWVVDTLPEAIVVAAVGVVVLVVSLNVLNALARVHATYTARALRVGDDA